MRCRQIEIGIWSEGGLGNGNLIFLERNVWVNRRGIFRVRFRSFLRNGGNEVFLWRNGSRKEVSKGRSRYVSQETSLHWFCRIRLHFYWFWKKLKLQNRKIKKKKEKEFKFRNGRKQRVLRKKKANDGMNWPLGIENKFCKRN